MQVVLGYLVIGVLFTAIMLLTPLRKGQNPFVDEDSTGAMRYLMPLVILLIVVGGWPAFAWIRVRALVKPEPPSTFLQDVPDFAVTRDHLLTKSTIAAVEALETVVDPRGAVPTHPFGFLNARWQAFIKQLEPTDELWSFEAPWLNTIRVGYAIRRGGEIIAFFHSGWRLPAQRRPD